MTLEDVMERKCCWAELLIGSLWDSNLPLFLSVHDRASNQQRGSVAKKHVQYKYSVGVCPSLFDSAASRPFSKFSVACLHLEHNPT